MHLIDAIFTIVLDSRFYFLYATHCRFQLSTSMIDEKEINFSKILMFRLFRASFFLRHDRNSNLNSHTHIFWRSRGLNPHFHREGLFGEGVTTGPNTQVADCLGLQIYNLEKKKIKRESESLEREGVREYEV